MATAGAVYARGPYRQSFLRKDPVGWQDFADALAGHSSRGSAYTMRGVQARRPSVYDLQAQLARLTLPTLIMTGDEDDPCLAPALFLKQHVGSAGLLVLPKTGHTINLEEPETFNRAVLDFLTLVESGHWPSREPKPAARSALLPEDRR